MESMDDTENSPFLQREDQVDSNARSKVEKSQKNEHTTEETTGVQNERPAVMGISVEPPRETLRQNVRENVRIADPVLSPREYWSTDLFDCCGVNDQFCVEDMEICLLGSFAPCVLYGQNMNRLKPGDSFFYHCCIYGSLCAVSAAVFTVYHQTALVASWYSSGGRISLRKAYNLKGYGASCVNNLGWCNITDEGNREDCDSFTDVGLHCCCHSCALCQEARELHRRTAHLGQGPRYQTSAPPRQTMDW